MSILDKYKKVALSNFDLLELVEGNAKVVLYPDMWKYSNIDELLYPYNACFLLFETSPKFGHWCALIKYGDTVEFFDSYSSYPDDTLQFIPDDFRKTSNQNYPYLTALLYECPYKLEFNDKKYQSKNKNINTCGRHCACRILFKHLNLEEYDYLIKCVSKMIDGNADDAVTAITVAMSEGNI